MTSSIPPSVQNKQTPRSEWPSLISNYITPPIAASVAIVPCFRDMMVKSALQKGFTTPNISILHGIKEGIKAAPTVGAIVGTQMIFQKFVEKALFEETQKGSLQSTFASSAVVGFASAPLLAIFNGQTMGWSIRDTIQKFTLKQASAISIQETAFVAGICASDQLSQVMKLQFGDNKIVEYTAAFSSGALGSLAGHPANTALTRWQSGLKVNSMRQLMWGSSRKAYAVGIFSIGYKFGKENLNFFVKNLRDQ